MPEELSFLNSNRVKTLKENIRKAEDERERLEFIRQLFEVIQNSSGSVVDKLEDGVQISNFDVIEASLHNEFKNNVKKLLVALKDIKMSNEEQTSVINSLSKLADKKAEGSFQTIKVKKPEVMSTITNLEEFLFPSGFDMNNVQVVIDKLEELKESFNIPAPQVEVKPPVVNVPKITLPKIPAPQVTVQEADFAPLLKAIKDLGTQLKKAQSKATADNADRLDSVSNAMSQAFAGFPGVVRLSGTTKIGIKPQKTIKTGTTTVTTAGTAVQVSAASVPCDYVLVSADLGNTNPVVVGDENVVAAGGTQQGVVVVPGTPATRLDINNLNQLWVDAQTNGDELSYAYFS